MRIIKNKIFISIYTLLLIIASFYGYFNGKESYFEVGFNMGSINVRYEFSNNFIKLVENVPNCTNMNLSEEQLIATIKTYDLYAISSKNNTISFCDYR